MTDHHTGYVVTLTDDTTDDEALPIINALRMVRGVATVTPLANDGPMILAAGHRDAAWVQEILALLDRMDGDT